MKNVFARLCLPFVSAVLVSCTTYYQNPPEDPHQYGVIKNSIKTGGLNFYKYENYVVEGVDGLPVNYDWVAPGKIRISLAPGPRRIQLEASQSGGFQSAPYKGTHELKFPARAGRSYTPRGQIEGKGVRLWIEDEASGKPVSDKTWVPFYPALPSGPPTVFIPPVLLQ